MGLFDKFVENIGDEAEKSAEIYAKDWLMDITGQKKNSVTTAPPPAGTLPADMLASPNFGSQNLLMYAGIALAVLALFAFVFKKGSKK